MNGRIIVALTFSILCGRNEAQNGLSRGQGKDISRYPVWIQQERAAIPAKGRNEAQNGLSGAVGGTTPLRCLEKVYVGFCKALKPQFFYNEGSGRCELFYYGGCRGNRNRFDSLEECQSTCRSGFIPGRIASPVDQNYNNKGTGTGYGKENARFPAPRCPLLTDCSMNCPNGLVKDDKGCSTCRCRVCDPNPCLTAHGPSIHIACGYGFMRDSDGCMICTCNDPCRVHEISCPPGEECQAVMNVTSNTYRGQCVQQVTIPPCPPTNCVNKCPYGRTKVDANGCSTCICADPCERCMADQICFVDPCQDRNDCRDYGVSCLGGSYSERSANAIDQPGKAASPVMPQTTMVAPEVGLRLQEAMRKCCTSIGLVGICLTTCETNSTLLLLDFPRCLPTSWTWSYLHCISVIDVMPKTTTVAPEVSQQAAMRKCCTTVRLVGTCLTTCETNSNLLLLDYTRCFPTSTSFIWDYVNCISVAQFDPTRWQPMVGRSSWLGGNIRSKRAAEQPNAADIPNENSSKNNGMKEDTKRINAVPYLPS